MTEENTESTTTPIYANQDDVAPLCTFVGDDASDELFSRALIMADGWVNQRLSSNSLTIWTETTTDPVPSALNVAATYYAVSDIVLSLYQGEDMLTQRDIWLQKAELMLDEYINEKLDELAATELARKNPVKHSNAPTYYERRGRKRL